MSQKVTLKLYHPHDVQRAAHELAEKNRYTVLAWGRQAGKSTWGNNHILRQAWKNRNKIYWFILPTWAQALVQFRRAENALWKSPQAILNKSRSELFIQLFSGSYVFYKSGKEFENLRTETLAGGIIDEQRDQHPDLWPRIIQPMLRTTGGGMTFTSTTNGFDEFYELYQNGIRNKAGWASLHSPSTCNPLFTQSEFEDAKANMSEAEFRQEIMAEFVELHSGKVYPNYSDKNLLAENPFGGGKGPAKYVPIILAPDFNTFPMCWGIGNIRNQDSYWFDEMYEEHTTTQDTSVKFAEKYKAKGWTEKVWICGDASGEAIRSSAGQSDYNIICQVLTAHGIKWENKTAESNPAIKDRVNNFNAKLRSADNGIHFWHHPDCIYIGKDLLRTKWKETKGLEIDSGPKRDLGHMSDGIGYALHKLCPIPSIYQVGTMRIIRA